MISIPADLLARLDEHARRLGKTRSGLLRELGERELRNDSDSRRREMLTILGGALRNGGASARHVREQRQTR